MRLFVRVYTDVVVQQVEGVGPVIGPIAILSVYIGVYIGVYIVRVSKGVS